MTSLEDLDKKANQCVKCGLCLNHCPTFQLTGDENRSPRGRIALCQASLNQSLPASTIVQSHLDSCLECGICESVCPANVDYISLLKDTKQHLTFKSQRFPLQSWLTNPKKGTRLIWLFWLTQRLKISSVLALLRQTPLRQLANHYALIPAIERPEKRPHFAARGKTVYLFVGCAFRFIQQPALHFLLKLLNQLGYTVECIDQCCGALEATTNPVSNALSPLLYLDSGCGAHLHRQGHHKVQSIIELLMEHKEEIAPWLRPISKKVMLHSPCTLKSPLKQSHAPAALLDWIPQLDWEHLSTKNVCCGGAGQHLLTHPDQSLKVLNHSFKKLSDKPVDFIATSNSGCLMQFHRARPSSQTIVGHPLLLLKDALKPEFWRDQKKQWLLTNEQ